jgi:hypothetical protein
VNRLWVGLGVVVALVVGFLLWKRRSAAGAFVGNAEAASSANRTGGGANFPAAGGYGPGTLGAQRWGLASSADSFVSKAIALRADSAPEGVPGAAGAVPVGTPGVANDAAGARSSAASKTQLLGFRR